MIIMQIIHVQLPDHNLQLLRTQSEHILVKPVSHNVSKLWSAVEVKILFKISALCGEYISQRIYKYVDVYINTATHL